VIAPSCAAHLFPPKRRRLSPEGLVAFNNLAWHFSAETSAILLVELIVAAAAIMPVQRTWTALAILSLFPLSIAYVATLEAFGFD